MEKQENIEGYFLDDEGYYVTNEIFRGLIELKKCPQCENYLDGVYAEKYLHFKEVGIMMISGIKMYGYECNSCNCGFIYNEEDKGQQQKSF
jgi:ribosomal protein L34E